jgi:hypothetical protein
MLDAPEHPAKRGSPSRAFRFDDGMARRGVGLTIVSMAG